MKRELIMLREVKRVYKLSQSLTKQARYRAVKSYASFNVKNGTIGQIEEICRLIELRDDCLLFCAATSDALNAIDENSRNILKLYYLSRVSASSISCKLGITLSCVYNRLYAARLRFKNALDKFGYDDDWLRDNFSHIDFLQAQFA